MKKIYINCCFLITSLFFTNSLWAVLNYTMTASNVGYTALTSPILIGDLSAGSDMTISQSYTMFPFRFDGITYTAFQVSDNGYIHLGNDLGPTGYGNGGGDVVIPNSFAAANSLRPLIAPLWEELAMANSGGAASYKIVGSSPNRTLTVQWSKVSWRAPTGTDQISFQVILYETTNIIDFIYIAGGVALGTSPSASIGLCGGGSGNFYSLNNSGTNPTAGYNSNTTNIATRPADGQRYRWTPPSTSLPVELLFFTGQYTDKGNLLKWNTASEIHNDYFTIERSIDGRQFEPVAYIDGAGNSHYLKQYDYLDNAFPDSYEIIYYRLAQTDFDDTKDYSASLSIEISTSQKKPPTIYYDHNSNELNISYNFTHTGIYNIEITDLLGRFIYQYPIEIISKEKKLWKNSLPFPNEGVYILKMSEPEGNILAQSKFIK